ncbi:MAG: ABC transporter ATP-binding protein [Christensenellales bacterium]
MSKIIDVVGLTKSYGEIRAVRSIDFYVEAGKLFAFLGPNGAGKSTTIDMLCTLLKPDSGSVVIDGYALGQQDAEIRSVIGVVFQDGLLDVLLTVEENLKIRGGFYGLSGSDLNSAIARAAKATGVSEFMKRRYGKLSGGQRRKADITRALVHTPKILFLDEPTTGLDPQTRKAVWQTVRQLQYETGMTVFLTTHYMEEAADADYVIVIDQGEIATKGTPTDLKERFASDLLKLSSKDGEALKVLLNQLNLSYAPVADRFVIKLQSTMEALAVIESCKHVISGFEVLNGTMDDAFIAITGKEMRE